MAAAYLVTLAADSGMTLHGGGANQMVVWANDATDAKTIAKAKYGAGDDAAWAAATATELVVGTDLEGWSFRVVVTDPADDSVVADVSVTAAAADQVDDVGADLVVALNATASIAGAAYNVGTNVLTVAETTDALGDHHVAAYAYPPAASYAGSQDVSFAGFFTTITDEGSGSAALALTLVALSIPKVYAAGKAS